MHRFYSPASGNPKMSSERVVSVRLLDVNDNYPKLIETEAFICAANPKPVIIKARDEDSAPYAQPFTFAFAKKSPNWDLSRVDGTSTLSDHWSRREYYNVECIVEKVETEIVASFLSSCLSHADTSARLTLRKTPTEDKMFPLAINIKDNAGLGISQRFEGESSLSYEGKDNKYWS